MESPLFQDTLFRKEHQNAKSRVMIDLDFFQWVWEKI